MSVSLTLYKASDGTAAVDASVALVTEWRSAKIGQPVSFQATYGAGLTGTWSVEETNDEPATYASTSTSVASGRLWQVPSQPAGSAGSTSLQCQAGHDYVRARYTPSSGGTGVLPTVRFGVGAGGVIAIPPDVAISPASSAASLAALVADVTELTTLADVQTELSAVASAGLFALDDVANDFDPSVSGLTARVGAVVGTVDGTKAWTKVNTGDTNWSPIS